MRDNQVNLCSNNKSKVLLYDRKIDIIAAGRIRTYAPIGNLISSQTR